MHYSKSLSSTPTKGNQLSQRFSSMVPPVYSLDKEQMGEAIDGLFLNIYCLISLLVFYQYPSTTVVQETFQRNLEKAYD